MSRPVSVDRLIWEQRLRSLPRILLAVVIAGVLFTAVALYSFGSTSEKSSTVVQVLRESSEEGRISTILLVKLQSGHLVKAALPFGPPPREGRKVTLTETETALFGMRRYHFKSYSTAESSPTAN
jgi:hypothetical protein